MPRKAPHRRVSPRAASDPARQLFKHFRRSFESLEPRQMLTAQDLMVGLFDGGGTLRYNEAAQAPAAGAVAPDDNGLQGVSGEAVAPDGSFYVSSIYTASVDHYSNAGVFLGSVGAYSENEAPIYEPGVLAFGPNGNLYVADLATSSVYQFDVSSGTPVFLPDDTLTMASAGYPGEVPTPGGFTFAANGDLILGDIGDGSVANYHEDPMTGWSMTSYYVNPLTDVDALDAADTEAPWMNPASIVLENNGNLLIADLDYDSSSTVSNPTHAQIVQYNGSTGMTSQFIALTTPLGTENDEGGNFVGDYAQPEALLLDQDGNLLVGVSPDHAGNGAVQEYSLNAATPGAYLTTVLSNIATPAALAYIPSENADLLVGDYDDSSVLRYDDTTDAAVPGGVPSYGDEGELYLTAGIAVATDGSYYVSSLATGQVAHYSSNGSLLGSFGVNGVTPAPVYEPGNIAFGPNGNLYVADLATSSILQFDVSSGTPVFLPDDTLTMASAGYPGETPTPGGFTFAADGDLILGDIGDGSVANYHEDAMTGWSNTGYYVQPLTDVDSLDAADTDAPWMNPASIVRESNGNLLIADLDYDSSSTVSNPTHAQVVQYNATTGLTSQFIALTTPLGTENDEAGDFVGDYSQPESLLLDQDGNLLVAVSPDHAGNGAIQKYSLNAATPGAFISTVVSGIGTPAGLALTAPIPIVAPSSGDTGYTAGESAVPVDAGLNLADANTLPSLSATVTISGGMQSGDALSFANTANITGNVSTIGGVYTLTLTGSDSLANYQAALQSVGFSSSNTSTAQRSITFSVTDGTQTSVAETKEIDVSAPVTVSQLYVNGTGWTNFDAYLGSNGFGSATLGYALKTEASQLTTLPWSTINEFDVQFSGSVGGPDSGTLTAASFKLVGGTGGTGGNAGATPTISSVTSLGGNAYQVNLSGNLGYNDYTLAIASTGSSFGTPVTDANGAGISGQFVTSSSSFPSGNGFAGSTFDFQINVLPGDANQNGTVNSQDTGKEISLVNDKTSSAGYNPYVDINANGTINSQDNAVSLTYVNDKASAITAPSAPSASPLRSTVSTGSVSFTSLALGVLESSGSTSLATGSSSASVANVVPSTTSSTGTTPASTSSSGSGSSDSTGTTASDGLAKLAATDEALSTFDVYDV